ncbi:aaa family atpase [Fusarium phyllophilum]|uniref:Aaa family atpase n=1 Tax=Fusarium phyllophilum TaxID=47803 RepID=A0A8H5KF10_9HYPO|nr:aaa family atpase [Fusarium phyllophilum]
MDSISGTVFRAEDDVLQPSSTNGEDTEDGSNSQQLVSQSRHRAPMMIDWRRKICNFLNMPSTCTDDEIIEELEIKDKLLRESESLKRLAFSTQGPPRVQIINRITCQDSDEHGLYLDEPWLVENGPYRAHLRCSRLVDNLELYLERNKDIVCIAYRDYECCGRAPPVPDPGQYELLVREKVDIVSDELRVAWDQLVVAVTQDAESPTNISRETFDLGDESRRAQETQHPYLWWFQHRNRIERVKSHLSQDSKNQVEAFQHYLRLYLGDEWAKVDSLIREGKITAKYLPYLFAPGQIIISKLKGLSVAQWQAYIATSWLAIIGSLPTKGNFQSLLQVSYWDFDGNFQQFNSNLNLSSLPSLTEEFPINTMMVFPMKYVDDGTVRNLRRRGQMFWKCRHRKYVCVRGTPEDHLYGANSGSRFMIDRATFRQMHPTPIGQQPPARYRDDLGPEIMAQDEPLPDLGDEFYICLPTSLYGFNMQKKDWVKLEVDLLQDVTWNEEAFDLLVMERQTKELVEAVVTNHLDEDRVTDVIHGKGNGLFILLHGGPGTGKTLTAESVAEIAKKPLYRVTCGDVGTKAEEVERYLEVVSLLGKTWGCVVLLDEADVFLEQRKLDSLERNALVSVFLRVLEYYDGIMILTSNRVGIFDEAFTSRIQLSLRYNDLEEGQRRQIWLNFINRLEKLESQRIITQASGQSIDNILSTPQTAPRLGVDIRSIRDRLDDLAEAPLNGREIRNMISTARQLAVFRKEKLGYQHLESVMAEAKKFGEYIKRLHKGYTSDQIKRAKASADLPTVAIEQPSLSFPSHRIRAGRDAGWIVKNAKATKIKVDDKTSSSSGGISEVSYAEVNGNSPDRFKMFPVEPVAQVKAEEEKQQHDWYITEQGAEGAPRKAAIGRPDIEGAKFSPQKNQNGQQDGEYHKRKFFGDAELNPTSPPSGGHGYPSSGPYGSLPSHRNTDTLLDCRLRSTHYTISQDHTSGQEAHEDSLLASFGKRRRTDKPSILLNGSRLLQRSPNLLPSLATGNDAVTPNEGSGMQKISQDGLDFLNNWKPIGSKMPGHTLFFPPETVINYTSERRHRGDEVVFEWVQGRSRRGQSYELQNYLRRQDRGTFLFDKSGDRPPASLNHLYPSLALALDSEALEVHDFAWRRMKYGTI